MTIKEELLEFKNHIDAELANRISTLTETMSAISTSDISREIAALLATTIAGGKRIRPFLVKQSFILYGGDPEDAAALQAALATELLHIFCLIHDDVMDRSVVRHNQPTIHAALSANRYKMSPEAEHLGNSQAILAGDILLNLVYREFFKATTDRQNHAALLEHFSRTVEEVCIGQLIDVDLLSRDSYEESDLEEKNTLKTAYYSIIRPLQLGALLANHTESFELLERIGLEIGIAYQLQDDLLDVTSDIELSGKQRYSDVYSGQPTMLMSYLKNNYTEIYSEILQYRHTNHSNQAESKLNELFEKTGAISYAQKEIHKRIKNATDIVNEFPGVQEQAFFKGFIGLLAEREK